VKRAEGLRRPVATVGALGAVSSTHHFPAISILMGGMATIARIEGGKNM
jgi:hypothetical protein